MISNNSVRQGCLVSVVLATIIAILVFVNTLSPLPTPNGAIFISCEEDTDIRKDKILSYVKNHWLPHYWRTLKLWPEQDEGDRIIEQMAFVPPNLKEITANGEKLKTILLYNTGNLYVEPTHKGQQSFLEDKCPVNTCRITSNYSELDRADAVIFTEGSSLPKKRPNDAQVWVLYILESPFATPHFTDKHNKVFNWTVTYRSDSDVPNPYGKFYLYEPSVISKPPSINYAANKTKKVAWFASNCHASNKRLQYVIELRKFIAVHSFGPCIGKGYSCPRSKSKSCNLMLQKDYKFYLSFENANCKHYITEKFFYNALGNDVVPIVMGARKEDYERAAPYRSYIHVDDFESPKALAEYLHELDKNDTLYNEYFQWKGTGEFSVHLNAHFWCRFCAMLHSEIPHKTYQDIEQWWRGTGMCVPETWRTDKNLL